tara:strand:+ start:46 stop:684 length:639 start_codon:yes stop_codon:yes gene_type:complete
MTNLLGRAFIILSVLFFGFAGFSESLDLTKEISEAIIQVVQSEMSRFEISSMQRKKPALAQAIRRFSKWNNEKEGRFLFIESDLLDESIDDLIEIRSLLPVESEIPKVRRVILNLENHFVVSVVERELRKYGRTMSVDWYRSRFQHQINDDELNEIRRGASLVEHQVMTEMDPSFARLGFVLKHYFSIFPLYQPNGTYRRGRRCPALFYSSF